VNEKELRTRSKTLSYVLRHKPDSIGIGLDEQGWVSVDYLLLALSAAGKAMTPAQLDEIVVSNDKNRFEFSEDRERIRARQGHSIAVALGYEPATPPDVLYHGTARQFVASILKNGLDKRKRHDVHLSTDIETMRSVGSRRGVPVILAIAAKAMHDAGHTFYVTGNSVWLTDAVPAEYIREHRD